MASSYNVSTIELPELTGTPKQIAWANDIRDFELKQMQQEFDERSDNEHTAHMYERTAQIIAQFTDAKWWINHRQESPVFRASQYTWDVAKRFK